MGNLLFWKSAVLVICPSGKAGGWSSAISEPYPNWRFNNSHSRATATISLAYLVHFPAGCLVIGSLLNSPLWPMKLDHSSGLRSRFGCHARVRSCILWPMNEPQLPRSPELMARHDTALLVVDVQTKLLTAMASPARLEWNIRRLILGAQTLGLPVAATEQYPRGLGPTADALRELLPEVPSKLTFSCRECASIFQAFRDAGIYKLLVVGIEAHVCVQQTVLDMLGEGFRVYVAVDAVTSRNAIDAETALRRMESSGATLTTTEAALFEWCEVAGTPEFKTISALVREAPPE